MRVGGANLDHIENFDPGHLFINMVPYMVDRAREAAQTDAHSHRDFLVGAAVFAVNPHTQETAMMSAGNLKAKHQTKVCAERKILEQAKKAGYTSATGLVVAATVESELIQEVTGAATPTLHPCEECQRFFEVHPLMKGDTVIVSTGLDGPQGDRFQAHTFEELSGLYARNDKEELENGRHLFGFDQWEPRVARYYHLAAAEQQVPEELQRPTGMLIKLALMAC